MKLNKKQSVLKAYEEMLKNGIEFFHKKDIKRLLKRIKYLENKKVVSGIN